MCEKHDREEETRRTLSRTDVEEHRRDDLCEGAGRVKPEPQSTGDIGWSTGWISALIEMPAALGTALLLSGLVALLIITLVVALLAVGSSETAAKISSIASILATSFLVYLVGGYAAGRIASRKGTKHDLLAALLGVLVTMLLLIMGTVAGFSILDNLNAVVLLTIVPADDNEQQGLGSLLALCAISGILILLFPFIWDTRTTVVDRVVRKVENKRKRNERKEK